MTYRIYALAKEYGMDNDQLMALIADAGIKGKGSALASLTEEELEILNLALLPTDSETTDLAPTSLWRAVAQEDLDLQLVELVKILESVLNNSLSDEEKGSHWHLTQLIDRFFDVPSPRFNVQPIHKARVLRNKFTHAPDSTNPTKTELKIAINTLVLAIIDSLSKLPPTDRDKYVK